MAPEARQACRHAGPPGVKHEPKIFFNRPNRSCGALPHSNRIRSTGGSPAQGRSLSSVPASSVAAPADLEIWPPRFRSRLEVSRRNCSTYAPHRTRSSGFCRSTPSCRMESVRDHSRSCLPLARTATHSNRLLLPCSKHSSGPILGTSEVGVGRRVNQARSS